MTMLDTLGIVLAICLLFVAALILFSGFHPFI